jgi:hypothetical protein
VLLFGGLIILKNNGSSIGLRGANQTLARVDRHAGNPHFIMEMGTSALSFIAHGGDRLPLTYAFPSTHQNLREMGILSLDFVAVI